MWLLEKLAKELFQDSIEYALDIDFSDSLIYIFMSYCYSNMDIVSCISHYKRCV